MDTVFKFTMKIILRNIYKYINFIEIISVMYLHTLTLQEPLVFYLVLE
jgi:hypothetical protein